MQFLNIAAIIMIINFSVDGMKELQNQSDFWKIFPILMG
jgi:hypothetical protein